MSAPNLSQDQELPAASTNQQQNTIATLNQPGPSNPENRDFDWKSLTICQLYRCPLCQHLMWGDAADLDELERVECSICLTMVPRTATSPSCDNSHLHSVCVMCLLRIISLRPLLHIDDALPCPVCTVPIAAINVAYLKLIHREHAAVIPFPMRPPPPAWLTAHRSSTTPFRGINTWRAARARDTRILYARGTRRIAAIVTRTVNRPRTNTTTSTATTTTTTQTSASTVATSSSSTAAPNTTTTTTNNAVATNANVNLFESQSDPTNDLSTTSEQGI